jgi:hypothetical protein
MSESKESKKESNKEPVFVVGFPKSGNTWLARLLAEVTDSNIAVNNPLDGVNMADNSSERKGQFIIHKEHVVNNIEQAMQSKVVYIVRDVRDVLVSGFYHCNRWCNDDLINRNIFLKWYFYHEVKKLNKKWQGNVWAEFKYSARCFIKSLIRYKYEKVRVGNWSDHVSFWSKSPNVIVVRYEDLLRGTEAEMKKILLAFKLDVSDEVLLKAISNQSFKKKKSDFLKSGDPLNAKFLRRGKEGGWKELLPTTLVREIEQRHAVVMNTYGYKLEYYEGEK